MMDLRTPARVIGGALLALAGLGAQAQAEGASGSILDMVLADLDRSFDADGNAVNYFINYAENRDVAGAGGLFVNSIAGAIDLSRTNTATGAAAGPVTAPLQPASVWSGRLSTASVGSSNTGAIDVIERASANGAGPAVLDTLGAAMRGINAVMLNGSANAVRVNGEIITQTTTDLLSPGAISASASGAINAGLVNIDINNRVPVLTYPVLSGLVK